MRRRHPDGFFNRPEPLLLPTRGKQHQALSIEHVRLGRVAVDRPGNLFLGFSELARFLQCQTQHGVRDRVVGLGRQDLAQRLLGIGPAMHFEQQVRSSQRIVHGQKVVGLGLPPQLGDNRPKE